MLQRVVSRDTALGLPMPERYRLAGALIKRAMQALDGPPGDAARASDLLAPLADPLDDPTDIEALDDAIERCCDALAADPCHVPALVLAGRVLTQYGYIDEWHFHPRPLRDARRLLVRARELDPVSEDAADALLRCELYARRFEQASDLLAEYKADRRFPWAQAFGRGLYAGLHQNWKQAEENFALAAREAGGPEQRSWSLVYQGLALQQLASLELADARMGEGVLTGRAQRVRLHLWSRLKHARGKYDEAYELNRRSLTFGTFELGQRWRQELLVYFRRLNFVPKAGFSLAEEVKAGIDGPFRQVGGEKPDTGDMDDRHDDDEEFVPLFRANLFLEGEHLPVVNDIVAPDASFEGRAKLTVRVLDPKTFEKMPLTPGERFKPGQYVMSDDRSGTVFHVLLMKRHNLHNPYLDLPEEARSVFDVDRASMQRFENAPWDVRLMLAEHGFDPLLGVIATCRLCDAFLRFAGGIGIDLETGLAISGGFWRHESAQNFDLAKHVVIRARETRGKYSVRTHGLCKFRRAELELNDLPHELLEPARAMLSTWAREAALGALYREGDTVGDARAPMHLVPPKVEEEGTNREVLQLIDAGAEAGATKGLRMWGTRAPS